MPGHSGVRGWGDGTPVKKARFREAELPAGVAGRLYLHSMPGLFEPLGEVWEQVRLLGITTIVALPPLDEIDARSAEYGRAIRSGRTPCRLLHFPVGDFKAPSDDLAFQKTVAEVAECLRRGDSILVHCAAGIGRTGMFSAAILMALGLSMEEALLRTGAVGSRPERVEQLDALRRLGAWIRSRTTSRSTSA